MTGKPRNISIDTIPQTDLSLEDFGAEELHIIPYRIKENFYTPSELKIPKPFKPEIAMRKLFPGHYYKLPAPYSHDEIVKLVAWSCPSCPKYKYKNYFGDEVMFPLRDSNETRVSKVLRYTDDSGQKNILVAFSTTEFTTDLLPCGRFEGAFLSLALFIESDSTWNLKTFAPVLGYYGSFQSLPDVKLLKFGKNNFGCYIDDANGPGGGPFYSNLYVFGRIDGLFKLILEKDLASRTNTSTNWDYKIILTPSDSLPYGKMLVKTTGHYSSDGLDTSSGWDDPKMLPDAIKQTIKNRDNFDFTIQSDYIFNNGKYDFIGSRLLQIKSAK